MPGFFAIVNRLFASDSSVIRRCLGLYVFFLPAMLLNFLLVYCASHILGKEAFSVFYSAISLINILIAPAFVLNIFFTRHFSRLYATGGSAAVASNFRHVQRLFLLWGLPAVLTVFTLLKLGMHLFLPEADAIENLLLLLIVTAATISMPMEITRSALQGQQQFMHVGIFAVLLQGLRFSLCATALYITQLVWPGILGICIAFAAICLFFGFRIIASRVQIPVVETRAPALKDMLPFALSYGVFTALQFIDVLLAFALMTKEASGIYSASAAIPKALLMLLNPIVQVSFPLASLQHAQGHIPRKTIVKGLGLTLVLGAGACLVLTLAAPLACGTSLGLSYCDVPLMRLLLLAAVLVSLLRFLVLLDFARGRDLLPLFLALPLAAYALLAFRAPQAIAANYLIACLTALALYGMVSAIAARRRRPAP